MEDKAMGKETKIGLSVIGVLLIVFVAVLVYRVGGWGDRATGPEQTAAQSTSESQNDKPSVADEQPTPPKPVAMDKPTRIPAQPARKRHPVPSPPGDWSVVSDDSARPRMPGARASSPPPPPRLRDTSAPVVLSPESGADSDSVVRRHGPQPRDLSVSPAPDPFRPPVSSSSGSSNYASPRPTPSTYASYPHGATRNPTIRPQNSPYADSTRDRYDSPRHQQRTARPYDLAGTQPAPRARVRSDGTYVVEPNDSFWKISESLYGTGAYFKALAEHNRTKYGTEDQLRVGDTILAPEVTELEKKYPGLCPSPERREVVRQRASVANVSTGRSGRYSGGKVYTVEQGDTLFDIARFKLGEGSRWTEIYDLNRDALQDSFDYLTPGMELVLPGDEPTDTLTRRPYRSDSR